MSKQIDLLQTQIKDNIIRSADLTGTVICSPYLYEINGKEFWVADVMLNRGKEILKHVTIAQYASELLHAEKGVPVRINKSSAGLYQIIGRAQIAASNEHVQIYNLYEESLLFTFGYNVTASGEIISSSDIQPTLYEMAPDISTPPQVVGDIVDIGVTGEKTKGFTLHTLTLGELTPLGSKRFGAVTWERI